MSPVENTFSTAAIDQNNLHNGNSHASNGQQQSKAVRFAPVTSDPHLHNGHDNVVANGDRRCSGHQAYFIASHPPFLTNQSEKGIWKQQRPSRPHQLINGKVNGVSHTIPQNFNQHFSTPFPPHYYTPNQRRPPATILSDFAAIPSPSSRPVKRAPRGAAALAHHQLKAKQQKPVHRIDNRSASAAPRPAVLNSTSGRVHDSAVERPNSATVLHSLQENVQTTKINNHHVVPVPISNTNRCDLSPKISSGKFCVTSSFSSHWKPLTMFRLPIADRMVMRIADERDAVQIKTFTKWINKHTTKRGEFVTHLDKDLRDGRVLLSLLEILTGAKLPKEKNSLRFHCMQNVNTVLEFLEHKQIKLVNIRAEDIVDGNTKMTLALVWTIVLHFHIADIAFKVTNNKNQSNYRSGSKLTANGGSNNRPPPTPITPQDAKAALLQWVQQLVQDYPVQVNDFSRSWRDGLAFCAILHCYCQSSNNKGFDFDSVQRYYSNTERLKFAFQLAEHRFGVVPLLDPADVDTAMPDARSIMTYVSSLYDALVWQARNGSGDEERRAAAVKSSRHIMAEYLAQASALLQWMQTTTALLGLNGDTAHAEDKTRVGAADEQLNALRECKRADVAVRNAQRNGLHELWRQLVDNSINADGKKSMQVEDLITPNLTPTHIDEMWQSFLAKLDAKERKLFASWSLKKADEDFGASELLQKAPRRNSRRKSSTAAIATIPELDDDVKLQRPADDFNKWMTMSDKKYPSADAKEKLYQQNMKFLLEKIEAASPDTSRRASSANSRKSNFTLPLKTATAAHSAADDMLYIDSTSNGNSLSHASGRFDASRSNFFHSSNNGHRTSNHDSNSLIVQSPPKTNLEPSSTNARLFTNSAKISNENSQQLGGDPASLTLMSPPSPEHQQQQQQRSRNTPRQPTANIPELSNTKASFRANDRPPRARIELIKTKSSDSQKNP